jgi:hypothetical protein
VVGYDPLAGVKRAAAERCVAAVNAEGSYERWKYELGRKTAEVGAIISRAAEQTTEAGILGSG